MKGLHVNEIYDDKDENNYAIMIANDKKCRKNDIFIVNCKNSNHNTFQQQIGFICDP